MAAVVVSYCKPSQFLGRFSTKLGVAQNEGGTKKIYLSVISSISEVSSHDWDACALDATGPEKYNPFLTHGFLSSLEETGCAVKMKDAEALTSRTGGELVMLRKIEMYEKLNVTNQTV